MSRPSFTLLATDGAARRGQIQTSRGTIETPAFMSCATAASVKALSPDQVRATGAEIILSNTYHLMLRPGAERIARLGGLHKFMGWERPILTDSGGYQVMSLSDLAKTASTMARSAQGSPTDPESFVLRCKDGRNVDVEIHTYPVTIKNQRFLVVAVAQHLGNLPGGFRQHHHHGQLVIGGQPVGFVGLHLAGARDHPLARHDLTQRRDYLVAPRHHRAIHFRHPHRHVRYSRLSAVLPQDISHLTADT